MLANTNTLKLIAAAGALVWSASAQAASDPTGIWFDHNGRGAVEIAPCASGKGLCGYVINIKEDKYASRCGLQILGNVTSNGGGWIYSPDRGKKYSVELTRTGSNTLQVVGNAGSFFSKTYTWNRAPDDIARCGETTAKAQPPTKAPAKAPAKKVVEAKADTSSTDEPTVVHDAAYEPTGASNASLALMGAPKKKKRVAEVSPEPAKAEPVKAEPAKAEPAPAAEDTSTESAAAEEAPAEENAEPERKCKFTIPYVGRVISVPCRD